ncbi:MAG TPA: macro domain-containing protein [Fimbriimonadaceae bacterium]|nr:macro domain-containing protein [Fimbriimonadaceae bacterium]
MDPRISVVRGSVIQCETEAIVNAANARLRGGGGVDGAIHAAAGPKLLLELQRVHSGWAEAGEVVVTGGHELPHRYIFHAVGPIWRGGDAGEPEALARCYRGCVEHGIRLGVRSIGFCSISTGIYGYPLELAAPLALRTVSEALEATTEIEQALFAMFGEEEFRIFSRA